jgi:quercetin dioxygenase-like cupin family protein
MAGGHAVRRAGELQLRAGTGWAADSAGYLREVAVGEEQGALHTGFVVGTLDPGAALPSHVHSFEESFYVVEGTGIVETGEGSALVRPGDYGVLAVGLPHRWRNEGDEPVRWVEMQAPTPRSAHEGDTYVVPDPGYDEPVPVDARDPRTRWLGSITAAHMDVGRQSQEMLAVSASMRTALLVYSGITVKMMVDSDLGARLSTMFMVQ